MSGLFVFAFHAVLFYFSMCRSAEGREVCLTVPPEIEACYQSFRFSKIDSATAQINCLRKLLWMYAPDVNLTQTDVSAIMSNTGVNPARLPGVHTIHTGADGTLPETGFRIRKEFRALSFVERQRLFNALRKLHETGVVQAFARFHNDVGFRAHRGAAFLPFHRVFISYFEEALRKVDPRVSLPYWDSTIDFEMPNPSLSKLWEAGMFGNGVGDVTVPPFDDWETEDGWLERDVGNGLGVLISKDNVARLLTKCTMAEISKYTSNDTEDTVEHWHDGVHNFIGGDMGSMLAPYDPVFYFHHAYVDFIWELFRQRQRTVCGINPETDYPMEAEGPHAADAPLGGLPYLRNIDGCSDVWTTHWYNYAPPPQCPKCTGNSFTFCSNSRDICVATRRDIVPMGTAAQPRSRRQLEAILEPLRNELEEEEASLVPEPGRNAFNGGPPSDGRSRYTIITDMKRATLKGLTHELDERRVWLHSYPLPHPLPLLHPFPHPHTHPHKHPYPLPLPLTHTMYHPHPLPFPPTHLMPHPQPQSRPGPPPFRPPLIPHLPLRNSQPKRFNNIRSQPRPQHGGFQPFPQYSGRDGFDRFDALDESLRRK